MSKTNHRRGFTAQRDGERYSGSPPGGTSQMSTLADSSPGASWGGDNSNGHGGFAKVKRGGQEVRAHAHSVQGEPGDAATRA